MMYNVYATNVSLWGRFKLSRDLEKEFSIVEHFQYQVMLDVKNHAIFTFPEVAQFNFLCSQLWTYYNSNKPVVTVLLDCIDYLQSSSGQLYADLLCERFLDIARKTKGITVEVARVSD